MKSDAKSILMAILTSDKEEEKAIAEAMSAFDAEFIFASTMHHLRDILFETPCSGLLLCITSLVGIDQASRSFVQTLEQVYPVARIRWNKAKGSFSLIASRSGLVETLSDFAAICSNFSARRLRRSERIVKTLNTLVSKTSDLANATRTFTINISLKGCFLHTSNEWNSGDPIFIQIQEMPNPRLIEGRVVRYVPWGIPFRVQGIGIQFSNLSDAQIEDLQHFLYYLPIGNEVKTAP